MINIKRVRVVAVIPTTSIFQIWEKVRDKFDVAELLLRVRLQTLIIPTQITPFIKMDTREKSESLRCNYIRQIHGDYSLGDLCAIIQEQGFADASIRKMVIADNGVYYTFSNKNAPMALESYVTKIRLKYLRGHGIPNMPQYLQTRVLRLMLGRNKMEYLSKKTRKPYIDTYTLFSEKTFNHLKSTYGHLFCKVLESDESGVIIRTRIEGVEETVWW